MNERLGNLLKEVINEHASDLHITAGAPPVLRIAGELVPVAGAGALSSDEVKDLVLSLVTEEQKESLIVNKEIDFSFSFEGRARFRVNAYHERGNLAAALRLIPIKVPRIEDLNLPDLLYDLCQLPQGFVLVTGPAGQGKSTTIAAMIDEIARKRAVHVVTIEDPIEYIFSHQKALVQQREINLDTLSWNVALRSALREDPDVVFIGEMRDYETISSAVTIAETGHLVFATLHTNSASQSVNRIVDVFPEEQQHQVQTQLASTLEAIISQRLLPAIGGGVVPACEILLATPAVRNVIREGKTHQIDNIIATSLEQGMTSLERDLARLVREGKVELDVARRHTMKPEEFERLVR